MQNKKHSYRKPNEPQSRAFKLLKLFDVLRIHKVVFWLINKNKRFSTLEMVTNWLMVFAWIIAVILVLVFVSQAYDTNINLQNYQTVKLSNSANASATGSFSCFIIALIATILKVYVRSKRKKIERDGGSAYHDSIFKNFKFRKRSEKDGK